MNLEGINYLTKKIEAHGMEIESLWQDELGHKIVEKISSQVSELIDINEEKEEFASAIAKIKKFLQQPTSVTFEDILSEDDDSSDDPKGPNDNGGGGGNNGPHSGSGLSMDLDDDSYTKGPPPLR